MKTFFCKLIPPRPTFAHDMSEAEAKLMKEHAAYWKDCMEKGQVVAFGFVADPTGPFGIGIVELEDHANVVRLTSGDPVIRSDRGFKYEIYQMPQGVVYPRKGTA